MQDRRRLPRVLRLSKQIPLPEGDPHLSGRIRGRSILDAFDDDGAGELRGQCHEIADDLRPRRIGFEERSEELADLEVTRPDALDERQM